MCFSELSTSLTDGFSFDVVVSNPPYLTHSQAQELCQQDAEPLQSFILKRHLVIEKHHTMTLCHKCFQKWKQCWNRDRYDQSQSLTKINHPIFLACFQGEETHQWTTCTLPDYHGIIPTFLRNPCASQTFGFLRAEGRGLRRGHRGLCHDSACHRGAPRGGAAPVESWWRFDLGASQQPGTTSLSPGQGGVQGKIGDTWNRLLMIG